MSTMTNILHTNLTRVFPNKPIYKDVLSTRYDFGVAANIKINVNNRSFAYFFIDKQIPKPRLSTFIDAYSNLSSMNTPIYINFLFKVKCKPIIYKDFFKRNIAAIEVPKYQRTLLKNLKLKNLTWYNKNDLYILSELTGSESSQDYVSKSSICIQGGIFSFSSLDGSIIPQKPLTM